MKRNAGSGAGWQYPPLGVSGSEFEVWCGPQITEFVALRLPNLDATIVGSHGNRVPVFHTDA